MASHQVSARSRRTLLATAAGGVAVAVADSLARPGKVGAADGGNAILGQQNTASSETRITNTTGGGTAIAGYSLVQQGTGIQGYVLAGTGVAGQADQGIGVFALNSSTTLAALVADARGNNTAVQGYSGVAVRPTSPVQTGVYGYAAQDATSRGVTGESTAGRGVNGIATSGTGVHGTGTGGEGVRGVSTSSNGAAGVTASGAASGVYGENNGGGFGTYGRSNNNTGSAVGIFGESQSGTGTVGHSLHGTGVKALTNDGTALEAQGRVKFSTSGLASVAVGTKSKVITPGTPISATTLILCTLESNQGGLSVQRVTKNTVAGTFTVFLPKVVAVGKTAKIAYFVIG